MDLERIIFRNTKIGTLEKEAFHNLTNMKTFIFENVTINKVEANSALVFLEQDTDMTINNSNISTLEFESFHVRAKKFNFINNHVKEFHAKSIKASVYDFEFYNNVVGWVHCGAFSILAQNVKISDNHFKYLGTCALQNISPGLPVNALVGFGNLDFTYVFNYNYIDSLEVGSLNPDWKAYRKIGGYLTVKYNALKCTCAELAWLGTKEGYGRDFSSLDDFHEKILNLTNNNVCIDTPCSLPVDAVRHMVIKDGRCYHNWTAEELCEIYYPSSTVEAMTGTTGRVFKPTPALQYFKRNSKLYPLRSGGGFIEMILIKYFLLLELFIIVYA